MLTHEDVRELLSRFTYKPNWRLSVMSPDPIKPEQVRIYQEQWVEDSRAPFHPWNPKPRVEYEFFASTTRLETPMGYYSPERPLVQVGGNVIVPPISREREDRFWIWLHDVAIPGLERHEMSEWFKVDGELMFDPHKAGVGR